MHIANIAPQRYHATDMPNPANQAGTAEKKPKFKIRKRDVRKSLTKVVYAFVAVMTIAGMIAPIFQF